MNSSLVFLLIIGAFAACVFLGGLVVFALRQSKASRRGRLASDGGLWVDAGSSDQSNHGNAAHPHHHHHDHHDASQSGSSGHDSGAGHGGHSGGFDAGSAGHSGGFDAGGFSGGHH